MAAVKRHFDAEEFEQALPLVTQVRLTKVTTRDDSRHGSLFALLFASRRWMAFANDMSVHFDPSTLLVGVTRLWSFDSEVLTQAE